jgi:hypothetical protein
VCEGEKTEPHYFRAFRANSRIISIEVEGTGYSTARLVQEALNLKENGDYDQVWCVFDKDSFPVDKVNEAFTLAERHRIKLAFSNEAFELWYLLHFDYIDSALSRHQYCGMLSSRLDFTYEKNRPDMYEVLKDRLDEAIRNAVNLFGQYQPHRPAYDNPSTTVHLLIQELRKFTRP